MTVRFPVGATFYAKHRTMGGNFAVHQSYRIVESGPVRITLEHTRGPLKGDREYRRVEILDACPDYWQVV
jgi:hypothetical protein